MIESHKGIILSGGSGSRLFPLTVALNKQLLPIYDKPMIYYPLATLISLGIRDVCIISNSVFLKSYKRLLGSGKELGIAIEYRLQQYPKGIAQSFIIGESFIDKSNVCLILGDNIFHSLPNKPILRDGASIFAYEVKDPERYGVVEMDNAGAAVSIEEKPLNPKSNFAIPGLYFYDKNVVKYAKALKPSSRGELEITDINKIYLNNKKLNVLKLNRGVAWLDAGTPDALFESGAYVKAIQERQGVKIGCIEEESYKRNFINKFQFSNLIKKMPKCEYKEYLERII